MTASEYSYLKSLPLVIHLPSLHTHLVHAGILPFNPKYSPFASEQPLAHPPTASSSSHPTATRNAQERALLTDIDQNTKPWVLLNMRSILSNNKVSRKSNRGTPWTELWTMIMEMCQGYDIKEAYSDVGLQGDLVAGPSKLLCLPINVVYGHAAARGLDVKRWSFGLDTGCVSSRHFRLLSFHILHHFTLGERASVDRYADYQFKQICVVCGCVDSRSSIR